MAEGLTFTTGCYMHCTLATGSVAINTIYDILPATASVDRRVYGISVVSVNDVANPVKIWLNDGTADIQIATVNVLTNSGNKVTTGADTTGAVTSIINSTMGESVFGKTRDSNGIPYLNLPKNWSIRLSFGTALAVPPTVAVAEKLYTFVFGEYY